MLPRYLVRKHPAPEGALRQKGHGRPGWSVIVRKHPAPEGALRLEVELLGGGLVVESESTQHQKVH